MKSNIVALDDALEDFAILMAASKSRLVLADLDSEETASFESEITKVQIRLEDLIVRYRKLLLDEGVLPTSAFPQITKENAGMALNFLYERFLGGE